MTPPRGRPVTVPFKKLISLDQELVEGVEAFRAEQEPPIDATEAIRRIIRDWLRTKGFIKD